MRYVWDEGRYSQKGRAEKPQETKGQETGGRPGTVPLCLAPIDSSVFFP